MDLIHKISVICESEDQIFEILNLCKELDDKNYHQRKDGSFKIDGKISQESFDKLLGEENDFKITTGIGFPQMFFQWKNEQQKTKKQLVMVGEIAILSITHKE
jgi:hypothetical protein